MSKNIDFSKLGPYSRKNSTRTGTGTKIGKTENNRAKLAVPRALTRQQHAGSAWPRAREGASRKLPRAPTFAQSQVGRPGSVRSARLTLRFGPACKRHVSMPRWSCVAPAGGRHVSGACRRPPPLAGRFSLFFFSSVSSENRNPVDFFFRFSYLSIRRSDRYDSFGNVLDHVTGYVLVFFL